MNDNPFRYFVDLPGLSLEVRELRGEERISAPFRFELVQALPGALVDPDDLVRADAKLRLCRDGLTLREIVAVVTEVTLEAKTVGVPDLRLVLEPRLALLRLRQDIRLFRDETAVQIVQEVLAGHGIAPELRLADTYAVRPYCVQLRESDLDFVNRLLEDEGIHSFLTAEGKLVLGDRASGYDDVAGSPLLTFRGGVGLDAHDDGAVVEMGARAEMLPSVVTLRDWNPEQPSLNQDVDAKGPSPSGPEWYDFPGEYAVPSEGKTKAQKLAEALACQSHVYEGRSLSARLLPGARFTLALAPNGVPDGEYVVTRVLHDWDRDRAGFQVSFEALRGDVSFRPLRQTPVPVLMNPLTGFVTGPAGSDIHTDEWGRVKVQFHWDRLFPKDDTCSYWIPVLQDNTGHSMSIPRVGWEVLVHFLEGDPDRPVVVGRVYNPEDPPHLELPINKTRSIVKSLTSPRAGKRDESGTNEVMLEDLKGLEFIQFLSEKDQNVVVGNDKTETVLANQSTTVLRDEVVKVGANSRVDVGSNMPATVTGNRTAKTGGDRTIKVAEATAGGVDGDHSLSIGGMHFRKIGNSDTVTVSKKLTEMVGGVILETALQNSTVNASKVALVAVGGVHLELAKESKTETYGVARVETVGGLSYTKADADIGYRANKKRTTRVGGPLRIKATKEFALTGVNKVDIEALSGSLSAPDGIILKVQDTEIVLKDGAVKVTAKTKIQLDIKAKNEQGAKKATQA